MYSVYKHTAPNGKVYVGMTKLPPEQRWQNGAGYKENRVFWKDILFYGWSNIKHEILATGLSEQDARKKEYDLIVELNANDPNYGYNVIANEPNESKKDQKEKTKINTNLLKGKMVSCGDMDCVNALARLLDVSRTTASGKLSGNIDFKVSEIDTLVTAYNLEEEDILDIFFNGVEKNESQ